MFASRRAFAVLLLTLAASAVTAQPPRGRDGRADVRGVVKSVDAAAKTITVTAPAGRDVPAAEKTYTLATDAEIAFDNGRRAYQPGTLKEIVEGAPVNLALTADQKAVESVLVEGTFVRGTVKAVDAPKRTITVTRGFGRGPDAAGEEKAYTVAADAEVVIDDGRGRFSMKEGKLEDLAADAVVNLRLSANQKQVVGVVVEGASVLGLVKSVDAAKSTITVTTNPARGDNAAEERTLTVSPDALTLLDDGGGRRLSVKEGKLTDVPTGSAVTVRLSLDQKAATLIRVEGPTFGGALKAVDADKGTITVLRPSRTDPPEEKTLKVGKGTRIVVDGKDVAVGDLKAGDETFVMVRLSLDQKSATAVFVGRGR